MARIKFEINALTLTIRCVPFCLFMPCSAIIFCRFAQCLARACLLVCSVTFYFATICINLSSLNIRIHSLTHTHLGKQSHFFPPQLRATSTQTKNGGKIAQNHFFSSSRSSILFSFSTRRFFLLSGRFVKLRNVTTFECEFDDANGKQQQQQQQHWINAECVPSIKGAEE